MLLYTCSIIALVIASSLPILILLAPRVQALGFRKLGRVLGQFLANAADQIARILALVWRGTLKTSDVRQRVVYVQQVGKITHTLKRRVVSGVRTLAS